MPDPPVAIGGVGGSGTRLVAAALQERGFFLGSDLNEALDNLWFTLLLKRPRWLRKQIECDRLEGIVRGLRLFGRAMYGQPIRNPRDLCFAARAASTMVREGHDTARNGSGMWSFRRLRSLLHPPASPAGATGWGWKEPNTHLLLPHLAQVFPQLRYIHVLRHGLDMTFSANQAQFHNWASLYGIPDHHSDDAAARLEYWIRANRWVVTTGRQLLGDRFLLVRFEEFCAAPERETRRLLSFLGLPAHADAVHRMTALCHPPSSLGRWRQQDCSGFSRTQLEAVRSFGYSVP